MRCIHPLHQFLHALASLLLGELRRIVVSTVSAAIPWQRYELLGCQLLFGVGLYADRCQYAHPFPVVAVLLIYHAVPGPGDMLELVEVASAELLKAHAYAAHGQAQQLIYAYSLFFAHHRPRVLRPVGLWPDSTAPYRRE